MTQSLPPMPSTKPKDKSTVAIIMAVLLHVLVALVLYFTVFNDQSISHSSSSIDKRTSSEPIITEGEQVSSINEEVLTANVNEQKHEVLPPDNINKQSAQVTAYTKSSLKNKSISSVDDPKRVPTLGTQSSTEKTNNHSVKELASTPTMSTNIAMDIKPTDTKPSDQTEYKLQKTQEYEQLDESIDQDSEKLAKLIGEVKKRNQSQIQQHQARKLSDQPKPTVTPNDSDITQDYPITPITPFNDPQNNQRTEVIKKS